MKNQKLSVMMLGLRGFPNVQGGVENHVEFLSMNLAYLGCEVIAIVRSPYQPKAVGSTWNGVKFVPLWAPKTKRLEAIVHTFLGVLYAGFKRPDVLHIHAIGPAILTPLARLMGLRVVVTHHGQDYERQKWGKFSKWVLLYGERFGMLFSNTRIVISSVIRELVYKKYSVDSVLIPNGVELPVILDSVEALNLFGLQSGRYVLMVSRLVPEKRHLDLINAFNKSKLVNWKLVLVGASDHPDKYTKEVFNAAETLSNVVCTGFQNGRALQELYSHAGIFVLPSSHEGLPISLLEALSYGLNVIASDIPANLEVGLPKDNYFQLGDINELSNKMVKFSEFPVSLMQRNQLRELIGMKYNWKDIAQKTYIHYLSA